MPREERSAGGITIGLEVHAYPATRAKLFCGCSADFLEAAPNANLCPVCTGQPGAKPMAPNREAIEACLRLIPFLGLSPSRQPVPFLRKHYFYPDLPSGYQRTSLPFGRAGDFRGVPLWEAHWEEDPGQYELKAATVDHNRSGVPLVEIVTAPAFASPAHARDWLNDLRLLFDHLAFARAGTQFKVDANVSLRGGERVEIKNVNGIKAVETALTVEAERQRALVAEGGSVLRETRHFDEAFAETRPLRRKEQVADYRYLPDPDLPSIVLTQAWLAAVHAPLPEDPFQRAERLADAHALPAARVLALVRDRPLVDAFEHLVASGAAPAATALEFLLSEVKGEMNFRGLSGAQVTRLRGAFEALLAARASGILSDRAATQLLRELLDGKLAPEALAGEIRVRRTVGAEEALQAAVAEAIHANPRAVEDWKRGKETAANFLVGQAMRQLGGRADAKRLREIVLATLPSREA